MITEFEATGTTEESVPEIDEDTAELAHKLGEMLNIGIVSSAPMTEYRNCE